MVGAQGLVTWANYGVIHKKLEMHNFPMFEQLSRSIG